MVDIPPLGMQPDFSSSDSNWLLQTVALPTRMEAARVKLLESLVFTQVQVKKDNQKEHITYRNILKTTKAHTICTVIWSHSRNKEEHVPTMNGSKALQNLITQHGLAVSLATDPSEVSKLNTLIRDVAIAREAYGLIERIIDYSTKVSLKSTMLINSFMLLLADSYTNIIKPVMPLFGNEIGFEERSP